VWASATILPPTKVPVAPEIRRSAFPEHILSISTPLISAAGAIEATAQSKPGRNSNREILFMVFFYRLGSRSVKVGTVAQALVPAAPGLLPAPGLVIR
jgi:hypothetical protein